uniref:Netrin-1-like n=1 Tax=Sinocyclocheilus rhinocerous TaxID=307959 RepID=A0A673H9P6_9TELE
PLNLITSWATLSSNNSNQAFAITCNDIYIYSLFGWTSPHDPCYHLDGRPRHCLSEFINTAYGVPVTMEDLQQGPKTNISTLTDLHNPHNLTCWTAAEGSGGGDWTLTVPLGRRFEITYISLQFCQQVESVESYPISILKSMDFGRSWRPLQFYSSNCMGTFGRPAQSIALTKHQETEPLCSDPRPLQKHRGNVVLAFSTLDGRPSSPDFDYSPGLQDWVTATDIKIVFNQSLDKMKKKNTSRNLVPSSLYTPLKPSLALSDLQVGGRCKCNGHASRCRRDNQGRALCQCEHHTSGPDCDVCEQFFYDRPWQRATPSQPHPCVPCECNGHSTKCRFSMAVYQQSGRVSGGICLKCRHHTTGRHCQLCQNGYTRDHSTPLSHRKACQPCQCHPMGAVGRWCNQSTGQCLCREGVTGQRCNRCAPGYKQGHSPLRPCIRKYHSEECLSYCPPSQARVKMNLETYCLKDYVLKVQVKSKERSGPWWQFSILVQSVFRMGSSHVKRGIQALWVPDRDLSCGCPALQMGRTFLLIGAEESGRSWVPEERRLVADRTTMALQWREHWSPKLRGFRGQDTRGKCLQGNTTMQKHSHPNLYEEYTPPHLKLQSEPHIPHKHTHGAHKQHHLTTQSGGSDLTHTHKRGGTQGVHGKDTEMHLEEDRKAENITQETQHVLQHTQDPLSGTSKTSQVNEHEQYHPTACPTWSPGPPV